MQYDSKTVSRYGGSSVEALEAILTRRSIRSYRSDLVPKELLTKVLEAGRWAASAGNSQPWTFIVVTDPEVKSRVTKGFMFGWFLDEAPAGIVICVDPRASTCPVQDGSLAAGNMMLAAQALGLGTCWINPGFQDNLVKEALGIPQDQQLICVLSLGYPAESPTKLRKKLRDITYSEKWGNNYSR